MSEDIVSYVNNIRNKNLVRLVLVSWHLIAAQKVTSIFFFFIYLNLIPILKKRKQKNALYSKATRHYRRKLLHRIIAEWHEIARVAKVFAEIA